MKLFCLCEWGGAIVFKGYAHIGAGTRLVAKSGVFTMGNHFAVSGCSSFVCTKELTFGDDIQFAYDCLVLDNDSHYIVREDGSLSTPCQPVIFGNKVWVGSRATILKGTEIPDNCVIGSCSLVSGAKYLPNTLIVGNPAKSVKTIKGFVI